MIKKIYDSNGGAGRTANYIFGLFQVDMNNVNLFSFLKDSIQRLEERTTMTNEPMRNLLLGKWVD